MELKQRLKLDMLCYNRFYLGMIYKVYNPVFINYIVLSLYGGDSVESNIKTHRNNIKDSIHAFW